MNDETTMAADAPPARIDLGFLFGFAFRDPRAFRKWMIGCLAVLLIPFLGFGLLWLLGFAVQTARGRCAGTNTPCPAGRGRQSDRRRSASGGGRSRLRRRDGGGRRCTLPGGHPDRPGGSRIAGGIFAGVAGAAMESGVAPDVFGEMLPEMVAVPVAGAGLMGAAAVFGLVVTGWFVVLLAGFAKALLPAGLMQLAATDASGRPSPGSRICGGSASTRDLHPAAADPHSVRNPRQPQPVALPGRLVPGLFWSWTASGAAIGHAGRIMASKRKPHRTESRYRSQEHT